MIFSDFLKNKALLNYLKVLPLVLRKDYGYREYYTWGQIISALKKKKLSSQYESYAVAMFIDSEELENIFSEKYEGASSVHARKYIADRFFSGDIDFNVSESSFAKVGNSAHDSMPGGTQLD